MPDRNSLGVEGRDYDFSIYRSIGIITFAKSTKALKVYNGFIDFPSPVRVKTMDTSESFSSSSSA
jgi:hypothetical protein